MPGKSTTPLEAYLDAADRMIVATTLWLMVAASLLTLLIKSPRGLLYGFAGLVALSFFLFCLIEVFPSIGNSLYLDQIGSHYFHNLYIADGQLVHKLKPHLRMNMPAFAPGYAPLYGIEIQPTMVEWVTDEDGFRNYDKTEVDDVLIMGDGFVEEGRNLNDTFAARIEKRLPGVSVRNLGTGGYGPFQYLEVLKRYGLKRKPKFAVIAFNEVNDIFDVGKYLEWKNAKERGLNVMYDARTAVLWGTFFQRYVELLVETSERFQKTVLTASRFILNRLNIYRREQAIHPDLVLVKIGEHPIHKMLFIDRLMTQSSEEILASDIGKRLKEIMIEFRNVCEQKKIIPLIMFIPSAAHVYAEYSTKESGRNWLKIRGEQIAAKANVERAISNFARNLGIELIDLSSVFESAAKDGRMLYYPLITHWNAEGMEVAAAFVADVLKSKIAMPAE
jgi:hypothetical protein